MQVDLKKIKPLGAVLILFLAALALITCFTADMGVPDRYESLHDAEYYRQSRGSMEELKSELEENVFPQLDGIVKYYVNQNNVLHIDVSKKSYGKVTGVLYRDFDRDLFDITALEE